MRPVGTYHRSLEQTTSLVNLRGLVVLQSPIATLVSHRWARMKSAYSQCSKLALLGCEFTPPSDPSFAICLDVEVKLVDLVQSRFKLPP